MSGNRLVVCPQCGAEWNPAYTMCGYCGYEGAGRDQGCLVYVAVAAVFPLTCLGYCALSYPLARFSSEIWANPLVWVAGSCMLAYLVYRLFRSRGQK